MQSPLYPVPVCITLRTFCKDVSALDLFVMNVKLCLAAKKNGVSRMSAVPRHWLSTASRRMRAFRVPMQINVSASIWNPRFRAAVRTSGKALAGIRRRARHF